MAKETKTEKNQAADEIVYHPFPRESSQLKRYNYNEEKQELRLQIQTKFYLYKGVPIKVVHELLEAESHGKYHASEIKGNYDYTQIAYEEVR